MTSPHLQALIAQGFLQVDEKKRTYSLAPPLIPWDADDETRSALNASFRAAHGEMLAAGYQWGGK